MKIVVVEDQRLLLELLRAACEREFGLAVAATAETARDALRSAREHRPDLLLLDLHLPDGDGIEVAETLLREQGGLKVLALSSLVDEYTLHRVLQSGIHGFVDKSGQTTAVLREALRTVAEGGCFFTRVFQETRLALRQDPFAFPKILTEREQELVVLMGSGLGDEAIAQRLGLKRLTVQSYRRDILAKLGLHSTVELIRWAWRKGFVKPVAPPP